MRSLHLLFLPHKKNGYHAYLFRIPALVIFTLLIIGVNFFPKIDHKTPVSSDKVLGIGSNISKDEVIRLTNQERANQGLPALQENPTLDWAATLKAQDMISKDYWAHNSPDGHEPWYFFTQAGYQYAYAGENLAKNFDNSSQIVSAWMASSSHKENILNKNYSQIGVVVMNGKLQGEETTLVVQSLGAPAGSLAQSKIVTPPPLPSPSISPSPASSTLPSPSPSPSANVIAKINPVSSSPIPSITLVNAFQATTTQKITIVILIFMINLFVIDKVVLSARRIRRNNAGYINFYVLSVVVLTLVLIILKRGAIL